MQKLKRLLCIMITLIMCCLMVSCSAPVSDSNVGSIDDTKTTSGELKVHYIDVGQADCILIQQGDENMLIDGGNNADEEVIKNYLNNLGIKKFKYIIGTHPHEDHIGSLDYVINSYDVEKVYFPKVTSTTKTFENLVNAVKSKNMQFTVPKVGETFNLGSAKCTIIAPNSEKYDSLNNYSIVIKLEFGNNSFLFTGDAEKDSEKEILEKNFNLKVDVLKVGHHGSSTSSSDEFLKAVNPKYAVISVGEGNDYGHPHTEVITKLNNSNIETYRTDKSGTIIATSDGSNITFNNKVIANNTTNNSNNSDEEKDDKIESVKESTASNTSDKSKQMVWVASDKAKVYHKDKNCSSMKSPTEYTLKEAQDEGLNPCSKCW